MGQWEGNTWVWNLHWRCLLYDWESEEVRALQFIVEQNGPKSGTENGLMWKKTDVASYPTKCIHATFNDSLGASLPKSIASVENRRSPRGERNH